MTFFRYNCQNLKVKMFRLFGECETPAKSHSFGLYEYEFNMMCLKKISDEIIAAQSHV